MKFGELRDKIFCPCKLIISNKVYDVDTHRESVYDRFEVEGVRARELSINGFSSECYIEVLCK